MSFGLCCVRVKLNSTRGWERLKTRCLQSSHVEVVHCVCVVCVLRLECHGMHTSLRQAAWRLCVRWRVCTRCRGQTCSSCVDALHGALRMLREAAFSSTYDGVIPMGRNPRVLCEEVYRRRLCSVHCRCCSSGVGVRRWQEAKGTPRPPPQWGGGWGWIARPRPGRTHTSGPALPDPPARHSGKRGHAHRAGHGEAVEAVVRAGAGAVSFLACWGLGLESRVEFVLSNSPAPVERRAPHVYFLL